MWKKNSDDDVTMQTITLLLHSSKHMMFICVLKSDTVITFTISGHRAKFFEVNSMGGQSNA